MDSMDLCRFQNAVEDAIDGTSLLDASSGSEVTAPNRWFCIPVSHVDGVLKAALSITKGIDDMRKARMEERIAERRVQSHASVEALLALLQNAPGTSWAATSSSSSSAVSPPTTSGRGLGGAVGHGRASGAASASGSGELEMLVDRVGSIAGIAVEAAIHGLEGLAPCSRRDAEVLMELIGPLPPTAAEAATAAYVATVGAGEE